MALPESEFDRRRREQIERERAEREDLPESIRQALDRIEQHWGLRSLKQDQWVANCEVHRGDSFTLGIRFDRQTGKLLVVCRKACPQDQIIETLAKIGVTLAMMGSAGSSGPAREEDETEPIVSPKAAGKLVEDYEYTDERGQLLYTIERRLGRNGKKTFIGRAPSGAPGIEGIRRVLYRLDELQGEKVVYVCEGEKCADALVAIGLVATTNPHGAGKWEIKGEAGKRQAEAGDTYADQLVKAGAETVVVLPDNDGIGLRHAGDVVESLIDRVSTVKKVMIPGLKHKGDVADWIAEGGDAAKLQAMVERAPVSKTAYGFQDERLEDVMRREVDFLWEPYIPRGSFTIIAGDPSAGKTMVSEWIAAVLTSGRQWDMGVGSAVPGVVVALAVEDNSATSVKPRMEAMGADCSKFYTLKADRRSGRLVDLSTDLPRIRQYLIDREAKLLIISPINAYVGTKINTGLDSEVRQILSPLAVMAEELDIAVIGIMHLNKAQQESILYKVSGSVGFVAASRVSYLVVRDKDRTTGKRFFTCIKANDMKEPDTLTFTIAGVDPLNYKSAGKLTWTGVDSRSAGDLFKDLNKEDKDKPGPKKSEDREDAARFLRKAFEAKGPRLKVADLKEWASHGLYVITMPSINWRTVSRAAGDLGIETSGSGEDFGYWVRPVEWASF